MASSFDSASRKLLEGTPPFPLVDLPASRDDSLWADLRKEYGLSLAELSSLKNNVSEQQQQSNAAILAAVTNLEKKIDDMATVSQPMSEATLGFTRSLFQELNLNYSVCPLVNETGDGALDMYLWGEDEHEDQGQPGCQAILEKEVLPFQGDNGVPLGFFDVRNRTLPELKGGKFKSNGFSDLALGDATSIEHAMQNNEDLVLAYADALVELKRGKSPLKQGQLLLQLASVSLMSNKKNGVVVLGTDCATKWRLLYFTAHNHVEIKPYAHGKKCLEDFKELLRAGEERSKLVTPLLQRIPEDGELRLKDFGIAETDSDKAIDREDHLNKLANALGRVFRENETPIVPHWARATSWPSYYV